MAANNETGQLDGSSLPAPKRNAQSIDPSSTSGSPAEENEDGDEKLIEMLRNAPVKGKDPLIGTTLGDRFKVDGVLGAGGMSVVYRATQLVVDRPVAIKTLHIRLHAMQGATERFQREIKTLCKLSHPNIVTVYDCLFSEAGQPFVIMDMLKGRSLDEIIKSEGPMSPERAEKIFLQICKGLEHAHRNNVIHRDLKPANVMLLEDSDDFVKVVDFGLAKIGQDEFKLTRSGEVWGSPIYMSPEQCKAQGCDARSDVYSLGVLMYETLTGKPPFGAGNLYEIYKGHITEPPQTFAQMNPSVKVPADFEKLVMRALSKEPENRFQSMTELKEELRTLYGGNYDDSGSPSGSRSSVTGGNSGVDVDRSTRFRGEANSRAPRSGEAGAMQQSENRSNRKGMLLIAAAVALIGVPCAVLVYLNPALLSTAHRDVSPVSDQLENKQLSAPNTVTTPLTTHAGSEKSTKTDSSPKQPVAEEKSASTLHSHISPPATKPAISPPEKSAKPVAAHKVEETHAHKIAKAGEHKIQRSVAIAPGAGKKVESAEPVKHINADQDQWAALRAQRGKE